MKKKALFFDYDGTLISDETHTIPKSARTVSYTHLTLPTT